MESTKSTLLLFLFKAFRFPLTLPGDWTEHELHGDSVTQMRLSFDDKRLVTTGKDGSLCIWKVSACVAGEEMDLLRLRESRTRPVGYY